MTWSAEAQTRWTWSKQPNCHLLVRKGKIVADLIAIGYPDETTAVAAADEARRLAADLIIQPDAIAVIVRDQDGSYHARTTHHAVGGGAHRSALPRRHRGRLADRRGHRAGRGRPDGPAVATPEALPSSP
jgi:hypothetical protein